MMQSKLVDERGTSLLEMALILPIFIFLLLGIIDIGRYAAFSIVVSNAARAGAAYGAQGLPTASDSAGIANAAVGDSQNLLTAAQVSSTVFCGCTGTTPGSCPNTATCSSGTSNVYVDVTTTGTFNTLFVYPGIPSSITVTGESEMRVAQ